jgi:hypothetical protein
VLDIMVLQERIELSTSPLPRECSTTELLQHPKRVLKSAGLPAIGAMSRQGVIEAPDGLVRWTRTMGGRIRMGRFRRSSLWGDAYQNLQHFVYVKQNLW